MTELHSVRNATSNVLITRIGESLRFVTLKGPYQLVVEVPISITIDPYDRTPLDDQTLRRYHRVTSMITPAKTQQFAVLDKETGEFLARTAQTYARSQFKRERREWPVNVPEVKTVDNPSETVETSPAAPQTQQTVHVVPVIAEQPVVVQEEPVPMVSSGVVAPIPVMTQEEQQYRERMNYANGVRTFYQTQRSQHIIPSIELEKIDPEQHIKRLQSVVEACKEDCVVLTYDIPDAVKEQCPNPSRWLWAYGFRFNLSAWMIPLKFIEDKSSMVSQAIAHWQQHGVRVRWVRQHPDEAKKIQEYAIEDLRTQLIEWHTSLICAIEKADKDLREGMEKLTDATNKEVMKLNQLRDGAIRASLKKASENLDCAVKCAEIFDMSEDVKDLVSALQHARESAVQSFNADAIRRGVKRAS